MEETACIATLYNPKLSLKNILFKLAVWTVKQKGRDIIKLLPKPVIRICWMDGKSNAADSTSKLMFDNISIMNSRMYRHGPDTSTKNVKTEWYSMRYRQKARNGLRYPKS